YLHYAVDGDGDGKRDLWGSPADAIFSVANYFKRHGWKNGEPVTQRVRVKGQEYKAVVNDQLKPKWTVAELRALGVVPTQQQGEASRSANLIQLQGKKGAEFWLGEHNFYVITRYNHSRMYAMAVYQLSEALRSKARPGCCRPCWYWPGVPAPRHATSTATILRRGQSAMCTACRNPHRRPSHAVPWAIRSAIG